MKKVKLQIENLFSRENGSHICLLALHQLNLACLQELTGWTEERELCPTDNSSKDFRRSLHLSRCLRMRQKSYFEWAWTGRQVWGLPPGWPAVWQPHAGWPWGPGHLSVTAAGPALSTCCQHFRGTESSCLFLQLLLINEDTSLRNFQKICPQILLSESATHPFMITHLRARGCPPPNQAQARVAWAVWGHWEKSIQFGRTKGR